MKMNQISTQQAQEIKETVKNHLADFLSPTDLQTLDDSTPLITGGFLDSITLAELAVSLEDRYGVTIHSYEMSVEYFDNLDDIAAMVQSKMAEQ